MNIHSIHANIDDFQEMLVLCAIKPDIIVISETKIKMFKNCKVSLKGYKFIHNDLTIN